MASDSSSVGVVLINLGTPDLPTPEKVGAFLKEFLMDPDVIDLPWILRWSLVHWGIVPKRCRTSAEAYRKIWTDSGSPLGVHARLLARKTQEELGSEYLVVPAMRYGAPSIRSALLELKQRAVSRICVLPLYPQYAHASTGSSIKAWKREARALGMDSLPTRFLEPFYQDPGFVSSYAKVIQESVDLHEYDGLLLSFHGLPERQIPKGNPAMDYRAQSLATADAITKALGIPKDRAWVGFQSRLGRTPWIRPYSDEFYRTLPQQGIRKLAVVCPSFVADCLETLEEVALRGREAFLEHGGAELTLIPCLNTHPEWVKTVSDYVRSLA